MPPAIEASDDESITEPIPHHITKNGMKEEDAQSTEEAEDGKEEEEEIYVVEDIRDHQVMDGVLKYEVKWMGYNRKEDNSWEPEENLEGAVDILNEYHKKVGGRPTVPEKVAKKRGRQSEGNTPDTAKKPKRGRVSQSATKARSPASEAVIKGSDWAPPKGSWEGKVQAVDTIEMADNGALYVFLFWNDGTKSRHPIDKCYEKCPQTMLKFYEGHLVFTNKEKSSNGN